MTRVRASAMLTISIAYVPSVDRHVIVITVPLDVAIPKGVIVQTDSYTSPAMHYRMCTARWLFCADRWTTARSRRWPSPALMAKINIVGDDGKSLQPEIPQGFAGAHDDMVSDAKTRAKPVQAPAKP